MRNRRFLIFPVFAGLLGIFFWFQQSKESPFQKPNAEKVIGILPFEKFPQREIDSVRSMLETMYQMKTRVLDPVPLPQNAFVNIKSPRYRADSLLDWMATQPFHGVDILLGLTEKDISVTKYTDPSRTKIKEPESRYRDFGIFGLGRVSGDVCVVSSFRIHQNVSEKVYLQRLTRIASHEVGHVLGLNHCPEPNCLMNDANESIKTIDQSTGKLCQACFDKIH